VRLLPGVGFRQDEAGSYGCDIAFGPQASQEQVYTAAVGPICDVVMRGYNGAIIAYGQTGSGKTHTMIGDMQGPMQGITPRAVEKIFAALAKTEEWRVEVSVLEIYNERVRDLLATNPTPTLVDIHEQLRRDNGTQSFGCPDATLRQVKGVEESLAALQDGIKRRETARTDMNHSSSRSHLIFSLYVAQRDNEMGAVVKGKLLLVDLAGSERLKRSMASTYTDMIASSGPAHTPPVPGHENRPRAAARTPSPRSPWEQRREACEINKSLSQLALVINRLTSTAPGTVQQVPYRDSCLTRLLADCFGGNAKTCLIITCSPELQDREETRCSLEFGKRAKLVKNQPEINVEVLRQEHIDTAVFRALVAKEVGDLQEEIDQATAELAASEKQRAQAELSKSDLEAKLKAMSQELAELKEAHADLHRRFADAVTSAGSERELLERQAESTRHNNHSLHRQLQEFRAQHKELLEKQSSQEEQLRSLEQEKNDLRQSLAKQVAEVVNLRTREAEMQQTIEAAAFEKAKMYESLDDVTNSRDKDAVELSQLRQLCEQLKESLEEKRAEASRLGREKAALQVQLDQDRSRHTQELAIASSRMEAERLAIQQQWHEAAAEAWNLLQSKAPGMSSGGTLSTGFSTTSTIATADGCDTPSAVATPEAN